MRRRKDVLQLGLRSGLPRGSIMKPLLTVSIDFQKGSVLVRNCIFSCNATSAYKGESSTSPPIEEVSSEFNDDYYENGYIINEPEDVSIRGVQDKGDFRDRERYEDD